MADPASDQGAKPSSVVLGYTQPPFDPIQQKVLLASGGGVQRGYIERYGTDSADATMSRVRFLYNPSELTVSYSSSLDESTITEQLPQYAALPSPTAGYTFGFTLMFDRTYELWHGRENQTSTPLSDQATGTQPESRDIGVLADVRALERLVGIDSSGLVSGNSGIYGWRLLFVFGNVTNIDSFSFKGFMNSMDVNYMHFNRNMIPTRCSVDISGKWFSKLDQLEIAATAADTAAAVAATSPTDADLAAATGPSTEYIG